jgi:hypothetical protein
MEGREEAGKMESIMGMVWGNEGRPLDMVCVNERESCGSNEDTVLRFLYNTVAVYAYLRSNTVVVIHFIHSILWYLDTPLTINHS